MIIGASADFDEWRASSRRFLADHVKPEAILWQSTDAAQKNLFEETLAPREQTLSFSIPKEYLTFVRRVACHRDDERWGLLYQSLWRMKEGERHLFQMATDPLMHRLRQMDNEVRRDAHKTKAFVRFKLIKDAGRDHYVAWHQPDHHILPLVGPFFCRRFSVMAWSILTPDQSVCWDGATMTFGAGVAAGTLSEDSTEDLWLAYYSATFNPARLKIKAMKREMPVRHWKTLPEAVLIPKLIQKASERVDGMVARQEGSSKTAEDFLPPHRSLPELAKAAAVCRGCSLYCDATQTVFGEGPSDAQLMLVGEQPGDQEDLQGRAFIGPAGKVLDDILGSVSLERSSLYITNAVKHFKFEPQGKRRIHKAPNPREINACKPWLVNEVAAIRPKVIVTLGLSAARSLIHQGFSLKHDGDAFHVFNSIPIVATWHPSAYLRAPDAVTKDAIATHMRKALIKALQACATP